MNYNAFRSSFSALLSDGLPASRVLEYLDAVAARFDIRAQETEASAGTPDPLICFLAAKASEEKSSGTLKVYRCVLSAFFFAVRRQLPDVTVDDVRVYLFQCRRRGLKPVTVSNIRRILNSFFEWCVLEQLIPANPVRRIAAIRPEKSPRHAMKRVELEYIRAACASPRDRAMIDFLFSTGARVSELCHARISDIDWERRAVTIRHGKGNTTRVTYLNPAAEVSLRAYLAARTDASPFIFARIRGSGQAPLDPKTVQDAVRAVVRRSGRSFSVKITPHVFRHTVATVALRNGMPLEQVRRFLGHSNVNTTLIYASVSDDDVRRSHSMYAA